MCRDTVVVHYEQEDESQQFEMKLGIRRGDMSQGCSQGYKPKTGPKLDPNQYISEQRKYKYLTS